MVQRYVLLPTYARIIKNFNANANTYRKHKRKLCVAQQRNTSLRFLYLSASVLIQSPECLVV